MFVAEWKCPVDTPEIPLEVCKVCLEARKIQSRNIKITHNIKSGEVLPAHEVESDIEIPQTVT